MQTVINMLAWDTSNLVLRCKDCINRVFCTFLLHQFQSLQGLGVKVLQVLRPACLNEHILLKQQGCQGFVVIISLWDSLK